MFASSQTIAVALSFSDADRILSKSSELSEPSIMHENGIFAISDRQRNMNRCRPSSIGNTATRLPARALWITARLTRLDLPMLGRAPTTVRVLSIKPTIVASSAASPHCTPAGLPLRSVSSMDLNASSSASCALSSPLPCAWSSYAAPSSMRTLVASSRQSSGMADASASSAPTSTDRTLRFRANPSTPLA